ncbi:amidohydrolase family protein [Xanthomonas sontii]|uniref:Amidohydrolase family protein n=1 Tax=Xanthomonas sontii TaxID=2650745 RepID=A0A6N7Q6Q6_9XANT|nr:amidohydrolase [Xanthomonas sontii]MRG99397.1 amidohydrolase family protein [Xanthomonas sontii]MRH73729.1 amidohydrolase family protein [Xanthomonas sontii]
MRHLLLACLGVALCGPAAAASRFVDDPYPSTYRALASAPVLIEHATVLTGTGERLDDADVLLQDGRVQAVGRALAAPANATRIDGHGKWVTPGIIDVHSHLGVYPSPGVSAHSDGNEATAPVTPNVWAEHSIWPQDPGFGTALAGGVTALQVLPGSANLVGGRGVTLKNVPATTYQAMKFPGAPWGLKMACGENPKRVYGEKGGPSTRMGNVAGYRAAFIDASEYLRKNAPKQKSPPKRHWWSRGNGDNDSSGDSGGKRDLKLDTLAGAINGDTRVHIHCYRADEMTTMLDLAKEFGFKIAAFHHGVEAYKIADRLAQENVCGALWADWWGFKMEAFDGIQENIALVDRPANGCAIVHSDSEEGIQRLNQEAAKAMAAGRRAGMDIPPERAIRWLTSNPAKALGIDKQTGSLEPGKMADVVLWNGNPFSSYALADKVYIDGAQVYDRTDRRLQPTSDFMLGQEAAR